MREHSTPPQKELQLVKPSLRTKRIVKPSPMIHVSEIKIPISLELILEQITKLENLLGERIESDG